MVRLSLHPDDIAQRQTSPFRLLAYIRKIMGKNECKKSYIDNFTQAAGQEEIVKYSAEDCPETVRQKLMAAIHQYCIIEKG